MTSFVCVAVVRRPHLVVGGVLLEVSGIKLSGVGADLVHIQSLNLVSFPP